MRLKRMRERTSRLLQENIILMLMVFSLLVIAVVDSLLLFGKFLVSLLSIVDCGLTLNRGINEGRQSAREVDLYLGDSSCLPVAGGIIKRTAQEIFGKGPKTTDVAA